MYSLLSDIFLKNCNIFLKPHPGDTSNYGLAFKNEIIIDRELPSELIKFMIDSNFDTGICTYTTSIDSLRNYINNIYEFDDTITTYKNNIFKLFFLYELAKEIQYSIHIPETSLSKNFDKLYSLNSKKYINYNTEIKLNDEIIVKDNNFKEANIIIEINKNNKDSIYDLGKIEKLYLEIKNKEIEKSILHFKFDKLLPLSNVHIYSKIKIKKG